MSFVSSNNATQLIERNVSKSLTKIQKENNVVLMQIMLYEHVGELETHCR